MPTSRGGVPNSIGSIAESSKPSSGLLEVDMSRKDELAELKARVDEQRARIDELERAAKARAPTGPSAQGAIPSSQQMSNVRGANVAGSGTGWTREIPLGPSMHQRYVDAQLDAQDAKDRRELIEQKAREQAALKAIKP